MAEVVNRCHKVVVAECDCGSICWHIEIDKQYNVESYICSNCEKIYIYEHNIIEKGGDIDGN